MIRVGPLSRGIWVGTCLWAVLAAAAWAIGAGVAQPARQPENRPMTAYSAKASLARLRLATKALGKPEPRAVWRIMPLATTLRGARDGGRIRTIGGWVVQYEDAQGKSNAAELNCWGEVRFSNFLPSPQVRSLPPVPLDEIVLDHADAHAMVLRRGGEALPDGPVGWLMNIEVDGRGRRPVWGGEAWTLGGAGEWVMVDAYTGEFYRPSEGDRLQPLEAGQPRLWKEWNGGFDEESPEAKAGAAEAAYWWPRAYTSKLEGCVYNRAVLRAGIGAEEDRAERDAASWMTSGYLRAALGDWAGAETDLSRAVDLRPGSDEYVEARGLVRLVARDLAGAAADFGKVGNEKTRGERLGFVAICRAEKPSDVTTFLRAMDTNAGMLPLSVQLGGAPLALPPKAPPVR